MRRPMRVIASRRIDLRPMVADRFTLGRIEAIYKVSSHQRDGVLKVAITP
jgi:alcohol dehydrogenase